MDMEHLERLVELMNANELVEMELETEEARIRLRKAEPKAVPMAAPVAPPAFSYGAPPMGATDVGVEGSSITFNSPMVGTFYTSSSPTSEPFVRVGDKVGKSTVLCIIEAMKVMNEITAETEGEILEVLVGNGEAVEYNQPLFTIKPR